MSVGKRNAENGNGGVNEDSGLRSFCGVLAGCCIDKFGRVWVGKCYEGKEIDMNPSEIKNDKDKIKYLQQQNEILTKDKERLTALLEERDVGEGHLLGKKKWVEPVWWQL